MHWSVLIVCVPPYSIQPGLWKRDWFSAASFNELHTICQIDPYCTFSCGCQRGTSRAHPTTEATKLMRFWKLKIVKISRKKNDVGLDHLKVCPDDVFRWEEAFIDCIRIQGINITRRHRGVDDDRSDESEEAKTHSHSFNVDPFNTGGPFPWWHSFNCYLVLVTTLAFSSRSSNPKSWLLPLATWSAIAIATTC